LTCESLLLICISHTGLLTPCGQDQDGNPSWLKLLLCVQWRTPDDGQRNCPKHVEFLFNYKFEKSVHLVGFIIRSLTRCTVTWTSHTAVFLKFLFFFLLTNPFWFRKITTDSQIFAHVNIGCQEDMYRKIQIYTSQLILDRY